MDMWHDIDDDVDDRQRREALNQLRQVDDPSAVERDGEDTGAVSVEG